MWGILVGLLLLVILIYLKVNIIIAAPLCVIAVSWANGYSAFEIVTVSYMTGMSYFLKEFFLVFLLGALFGSVISASGASETLACRINDLLGASRAAAAVFLTSAILAYGGISGFVIIFSLYPIGLSLFEKAGLPRYLLPACITAGVSNMAVNLPGSPQVHNIIPVEYLGTNLMAGFVPALAGVAASSILAVMFLQYRSRKAIQRGETFMTDRHDVYRVHERESGAPGIVKSLLPLLVVVILITVCKVHVVLALLFGTAAALVLLYPHLDSVIHVLNKGANNAIMPLLFAASAVGFGFSLRSFPSFLSFLDSIMDASLNPLVLSSLLVHVSSGLMGSASGGLVLALTTAGEQLAQYADPSTMHRVMTMSSVVFDTLPYNNSYLAILAFTGLTFKETYYDYFMVTVLTPLIGLIVALSIAVVL